MGYLVSGHFPKQRPTAALVRTALPQSIGFSLYGHNALPVFAVDTYRATKPSKYPFSTATPATDIPLELPPELASLSHVYEQLRSKGGSNGLKRAYINLSRVLSSHLGQPVLSLFSDDDGSDFACLSDSGKARSIAAKCNAFLVEFRNDEVTQTVISPERHSLHAVALKEFESFFGIPGSQIGLGTFDPPENYGFVQDA